MTSEENSILNDLIKVLGKGEEGFRSAAESVNSSHLKALLVEFSLQRGKFAGELRALANHFGEGVFPTGKSPVELRHADGAHFGSATKADDNAVLNECERGEHTAVSAYDRVFEEHELSADIEPTLRKQFVDIEETQVQLRMLRNNPRKR